MAIPSLCTNKAKQPELLSLPNLSYTTLFYLKGSSVTKYLEKIEDIRKSEYLLDDYISMFYKLSYRGTLTSLKL